LSDDNQALLLQMSADLSQLSKALKRGEGDLNKSCDAMQRKAQQTENALKRAFGGGSFKLAINTTALAATSKLLEEGAGRAGVFGAALSGLGGPGLVAAGAITAVSVAVDRGIKFTEKAAEIERLSKTLELTTTQVQEFGHVFTELNVPVDQGLQALSTLRAQIGQYETNTSRFGAKIFGAELGIKPEDLKNAGSFEAQLKLILDDMGKLSADARLGAIKRLGLDPAAINSLVDGRAKWSELVAEANRYGLVIDENVIRKGAEANRELKDAADIISTRLTVAFADLSPVIVDVANALAHAIEKVDQFIGEFKKIPDRTTVQLQGDKADLEGRMAESRKWFPGIDTAPAPKFGDSHFGDIGYVIDWGQQKKDAASLKEINDQLAFDKLRTGVHDLMDSGGASTPFVPGKTPHAKADHGPTEIADAEVRYIEALIRGAQDLDEAHQLRLKLVDAQWEVAAAKAAQEKKPAVRAKLLDTAGLTHGADIADENLRYAKAQNEHTRAFTDELQQLQEGQLQAQAEITGLLQDRQAAERKQLVDEQDQKAEDLATKLRDDPAYHSDAGRQEGSRLISAQASEFLAQNEAQRAKQSKEAADQEADIALRGLTFDNERLKALQELATTQAERKSLAQQLLANEQKQAEIDLEKRARDEGWSPQDLATARANLGITNKAQQKGLDQQFAGPIAKFAQDNSAGDLGTKIQSDAASAVETLDSGLAAAIVKGKTLKDVLLNAFQSFAQNALKQTLDAGWGSLASAGSSAASQPGGGAFASAASAFSSIFKFIGFGAGTPPGGAPGGLAIIGEHGPELANVPKGTEITPNGGLRALLNGPSLRSGPARLLVSVANQYDMRGNSGDAAIQGWIAASEARTQASIVPAVKQALPGLQVQQSYETG
jgi:hypothetical protein